MASIKSARLRWDILRSLDWTLVTNNYVAVGTSLENPARLITILNDTDVNILISDNGIYDKKISIANSMRVMDLTANSAPECEPLEFSANQYIWVKAEGALPTSGKIYFEIDYADSK